jgi:hypothetical protein
MHAAAVGHASGGRAPSVIDVPSPAARRRAMAGYLGINSAPVGRTARTGLDFQAQQESAATNSVPDAMLGLSGDLGIHSIQHLKAHPRTYHRSRYVREDPNASKAEGDRSLYPSRAELPHRNIRERH